VTDELIEKMAKAMCLADSSTPENGDVLWGYDGALRAHYIDLARAALQAIEESGYVLHKAVSADLYGKSPDKSPESFETTVKDDDGCWRIKFDFRPWKEGNNG
jgi:hypothetical protein